MKNWKTTTAGIAGILPLLYDAVQRQDWLQAVGYLGLLVWALVSKDHDVFGGRRGQ